MASHGQKLGNRYAAPCKDRRVFMSPEVGMALLLPRSLFGFPMVPGRGLIALKPASAWFEPLTLKTVVHSCSSIRANGHMLLTRVILQLLILGSGEAQALQTLLFPGASPGEPKSIPGKERVSVISLFQS